jgi:hypothetical protein
MMELDDALAITRAPADLPAVDDLTFGELAARLPPPRDTIVATRTLDTLLQIYSALAVELVPGAQWIE